MNEWCLGLEECTVQWKTSCHVYQVAIVKFAIFSLGLHTCRWTTKEILTIFNYNSCALIGGDCRFSMFPNEMYWQGTS